MTRMRARLLVIRALSMVRCHGLRNDYLLGRLRLNDEKALCFIKEFFRNVDEAQHFDILNQDGQIIDRAGHLVSTFGDLVSLVEGLNLKK